MVLSLKIKPVNSVSNRYCAPLVTAFSAAASTAPKGSITIAVGAQSTPETKGFISGSFFIKSFPFMISSPGILFALPFSSSSLSTGSSSFPIAATQLPVSLCIIPSSGARVCHILFPSAFIAAFTEPGFGS
ncbi:MAG: hypothetical protein BWY84_01110 [Candidatus Aerophobetes bacterium ADurb.Bin490]|nr:MAG: hypothetical protein BWY84_01110 [Candidatus Aerophobetes bacterium ADurb.Bin490]